MARLSGALQAPLRRPRTRRGRRTFHASCCDAPSDGHAAAAADGDSTDPIRASGAPTKTKNLKGDFAARGLTVAGAPPAAASASPRPRPPSTASRAWLLDVRHHVLDDRVVLDRVDAEVLAVAG